MYSLFVTGIVVYGLVVAFKSALNGGYSDRERTTHDKLRAMTEHEWYQNTPYDKRLELWNWATEEEKVSLREKYIYGVEDDWSGDF